jgi:hypothetical protein
MGVLKPRKKMVSLRLADDEYDRLIQLCSVEGAHSASDLARTAVCDYLLSRDIHSGYDGSTGAGLRQKVEKLEEEVRRLSRMAASATAGGN